ncbi:cysteine dioxygenase [Variovorax sp. WS11]|uniref:cysteine dioxygenase family protein n=2 Tax=Variovorax sp. WS11 TaxID=1105204 RepID=UPI0026CC6CDB
MQSSRLAPPSPHEGGKLLRFVRAMTHAVARQGWGEAQLVPEVERLLRELVAKDDWLPEAFARAHPDFYQQYLLYGDPLDRFSVVSFVWGPGQFTPVHNHTVWGAIGMLRGAELGQAFGIGESGQPPRPLGKEERLEPGMVALVSPSIGDVHQVRNAYPDRVSISVHVYGGNIGRIRRQVFAMGDGAAKDFVSGYSGDRVPNLWAGEGA